ncbi:MAG: YceI family protein [Pseudomonadota bacterium]
MKKQLVSFALAFAFVVPSAASAAQWDVDPAHSQANFSVRHMTVSTVRGTFTGISGTFDIDEKDPTKGQIDVAIDVNTVDTKVEKRDQHLKSPDFFDPAKYPAMTFKATKITGKKGKYKVHGDLTIRDKTKPVVLDVTTTGPVKSPWGQTVVGVEATTTINRQDFGVAWNNKLETGGLVVGNEVKIDLALELIKK